MSRKTISSKYKYIKKYKVDLPTIPENIADDDNEIKYDVLLKVGKDILFYSLIGAASGAAADYAANYISKTKKNNISLPLVIASAAIYSTTHIKERLSSENIEDRNDYAYASNVAKQTLNKILFGDNDRSHTHR